MKNKEKNLQTLQKNLKSIRAKKQTISNEECLNLQKPKIGIVGIGSIGTTLAVLLCKAGYDVEITKKSPNALRIDNCINLEINGVFGNSSYLVPCVEDNNFTSKKDIIIMCTQSYSTASALKEIKKHLKKNGVVVSMQNVLNFEDVVKVIPKTQYVGLVIDWTATRLETNRVLVLTNGDMHIGVIDDNANQYLSQLHKIFACISNVNIQNEFLNFVINKFILTCSLSCVMAIAGHNLKQTLTHKTAKKLIVGLICEMVEVFTTYGVKISSYCNMLSYYQFINKSLGGVIYRAIMFKRLSTKNGDMCSSVLRALEQNRKTELDYLCEKVVKLAKAKNIDVPFNKAVASFLKAVEDGKQSTFIENLDNECFENLKINWR